jgi:hypothetical protein
MNNYIDGLCIKVSDDSGHEISEKISLLFEGAIVTAQVSQFSNAVKIAKDSAQIIIDHYTN